MPENFNPDCGISFKAAFNENTPFPSKHEPIGTNLLDAAQTEAMVLYMIDGMPGSEEWMAKRDDAFDRVHRLVLCLEDWSRRLGHHYMVAWSTDVGGGCVRLLRDGPSWELRYEYLGKFVPLRDTPMDVRREFLRKSGDFFAKYVDTAERLVKDCEVEIATGTATLTMLERHFPHLGPAPEKS